MFSCPEEVPPTAGLPISWQDWRLPMDTAFLTRMAAFLGTPTLQLECSGTAALMVALITLKHIHPDRKTVIIPAYTCPLVPIAIRQCGLESCLCDLMPGHFDMDPEKLKTLCRAYQPLAIVPTHLGGRIANVATAVACAQACGALVIEDAAQALGARDRGLSVGLQGDIGFFSLALGKGLTLFEGGLLLSRHTELARQMKAISTTFIPKRPFFELLRIAQLLGYTACYHPKLLRYVYGIPLRRSLRKGKLIEAVGDNFPMHVPLHRVGAWRQSVGSRALTRLPQWIATINQRAEFRIKRLLSIEGIHVLQDTHDDQKGIWPFFILWLPSIKKRDDILNLLWEKGVGVTRLFAHALPDYAYLHNVVPRMETPEARRFAAHTLSISNSPWLDDARFEHICQVIEQVMRNQG